MDQSVPHPLVYAVIEVRVPFAPRLSRAETAEKLQESLTDLPILRAEKRQRITQNAGNIEVSMEDGWRFLDLQNSKSLILTNTSIVFETTRYAGFPWFLGEFQKCLSAISDNARPAGYERIGLRYINEIWPNASVGSIADWTEWVAPELIGSLARSEPQVLGDSHVEPYLGDMEVNLQFVLDQNCGLTTRVATQTGFGAVGNAPLKRWVTPDKSSKFCVIDFDGFWPRESEAVQPFDQGAICDLITNVHRPVKRAFRWATTSELRKKANLKDENV